MLQFAETSLVTKYRQYHFKDEEHRGFTVWFTGLSGVGKTTIATLTLNRLRMSGIKAELLDGDAIRTHLSNGLGFTKEDREENIRRIGFLAELLNRNGVASVVAAISPYRAARDEVRSRVSRFIEVYVDCPLALLIEQDPKGLYRRALSGELANFTGISDIYEPPFHAELTIDSSRHDPEQCVVLVLTKLLELGVLSLHG